MAFPLNPSKARLFCAVFYSDKSLYNDALIILKQNFGAVETESDEYNFSDFTDYYKEEMGEGIFKKIIIFKNPIERTDLPDIKIITNEIELELSEGNKREINIDPGYFTLNQAVLASCKEMPHRIYLDKGVYADLMYAFSNTDVFTTRHTFPDYQDKIVKDFFLKERNKLKK